MISHDFVGELALDNKASVLFFSNDEYIIDISNRIRTKPFVGMKQPYRKGTILGVESILKITAGNNKRKFKWRLYKNDRYIQKGTTDENGFSDGLKIEFDRSIYKITFYMT